MELWRVKSKSGKIIHLSADRKKTLCGKTIGDSWKTIFALEDIVEGLEMVPGLCEKCNEENLLSVEMEMASEKEKEQEEYNPPTKVHGLGTW